MHNLLHTLKCLDERAALCGCAGVLNSTSTKYTVLYHGKAQMLAEDLKRLNSDRFTLSRTEWSHFGDGTDKIINETMQGNKKADGAFSGHNILFVASFHDNADTLSQFHFLHYLCSQQRPATMTILLPFFCTGTMERISPGEEGWVPTAATLASMFSTLPFQGGVRVMTYDVHVLAEKFFFQGHATLTTHTAIPLLLTKLGSAEIDCIVFPDDGAKKRFEKLFNPERDASKYTIMSCTKEHIEGDTNKLVKVESGVSIARKNTIIVDDMTRSGNTLFQCMDAIIKAGAASVSMFVTHGAFTSEFWANLMLRDQRGLRIKRIYTTDSISGIRSRIVTEAKRGTSNLFEVLSLASQINEDL
jgi:phosphoribosylpyrophosphate synthetase